MMHPKQACFVTAPPRVGSACGHYQRGAGSTTRLAAAYDLEYKEQNSVLNVDG
jgi:hypothetical protein